MMGETIYLNPGNAEETLPKLIDYLKQEVAQESRSKAFQDCTTYWAGEIEKILKDPAPSAAKLSRIRQLFNIPYNDEE